MSPIESNGDEMLMQAELLKLINREAGADFEGAQTNVAGTENSTSLATLIEAPVTNGLLQQIEQEAIKVFGNPEEPAVEAETPTSVDANDDDGELLNPEERRHKPTYAGVQATLAELGMAAKDLLRMSNGMLGDNLRESTKPANEILKLIKRHLTTENYGDFVDHIETVTDLTKILAGKIHLMIQESKRRRRTAYTPYQYSFGRPDETPKRTPPIDRHREMMIRNFPINPELKGVILEDFPTREWLSNVFLEGKNGQEALPIRRKKRAQ